MDGSVNFIVLGLYDRYSLIRIRPWTFIGYDL